MSVCSYACETRMYVCLCGCACILQTVCLPLRVTMTLFSRSLKSVLLFWVKIHCLHRERLWWVCINKSPERAELIALGIKARGYVCALCMLCPWRARVHCVVVCANVCIRMHVTSIRKYYHTVANQRRAKAYRPRSQSARVCVRVNCVCCVYVLVGIIIISP